MKPGRRSTAGDLTPCGRWLWFLRQACRGRRCTVGDHTPCGRWLSSPAEACRGRKLWCVRCDYDRDVLFNTDIVYITSIRRYRLYLIISPMKCVELLQRYCDREGVKVCITHIIKRLFVSFREIYIYHTFGLTKLSHNSRLFVSTFARLTTTLSCCALTN